MSDEQPRGVQVRLAVEAADACPVATATDDGATARAVTWSRATDDDRVVEEFDLVNGGDGNEFPDDATVVFGTDDTDRVRFSRDGSDCLCDRIERFGAPVTDVRATRGTLLVTVHATEVETIREIVDDLQEDGPVRIDRLTQTGEGDADDLVLVDRSKLTDRQQEVLETAVEMGYFQRPRDANATEVAEALDISPSTFAEHLASAQSKILTSLLQEPA